MSSPKFAAPLQLDPRPSRRLAHTGLILHGGALAVLAALALPWWAVLAVSGAVIGNFVLFFRTHVLRVSAHAVVKLVWDEAGGWTVVTPRGPVDASLAADSVVYPRLVILRFATGAGGWLARRRLSVILLPDSLDAETFRRLRARLEMEGNGS
ncbi:MAG: hypothetical protein B7Z66_06640 [Chromatiales bacterium 21-64-14]|nr:MAG: hypothetical protein B7Z66_06640 [Chromatiales bacterium 21-64-14]HQU16542.1 hypothetical protein [Gammaproteobacteria bacterium]